MRNTRRIAEIGTIALLCLVNIVVFSARITPVPLVPFAAVVIATVIFGQRMASAGVLLTALAGLASLLSRTGLLMTYVGIDDRVLMLQGFLAVLTLTCLPIAAVLQERKALSDRLMVAEARYRLLSEGSGDAILHVDLDGTLLHASRAVTDLIGLAPEDLVGRSGVTFVHPADRAAVQRAHGEVVRNGGAAAVRYRYTHQRNGDERWLEIRTRAILTGVEVSGVIATVRDVTLLAAQERQMTQEAATDPLTGVANRRHLMT